MEQLIGVVIIGLFVFAAWGAVLVVGDKEREFKKRREDSKNDK